MKKLLKSFTVVLLLSILMNACTSSKEATAVRKDVKGSWTLTSVTPNAPTSGLRIQLFDDSELSCFSGSTWELPNNGYGSYTITKSGSGCTSGIRNIIWSYRQENGETVFQFKKLQEGVKAKNIEDGYKLKIVSATADNLLLQSVVNFEGKNITLDYNFVKKP